ncbi:GntR family transcriptional regulator [Zavarzinia sp. CC-PAN008]|uniref:GntR family transcriptional regulator n=1 Tax=Zavarzinia sp. CC-PAN008 TaxID=3243332 RepID=UPI003F749807
MSTNWRIEAPKSTTVQAYERLRRAIIDGEFQPGERLTELGIAALFGVSRTPVRESLARLAVDGLVRAMPGGGMEVVDPYQELVDIYHIREAIEGCAARLASVRASDAERAEIRRLAQATLDAEDADVETRARLNREFHSAIAAASHAPRLERLVADYREFFASPRMLRAYRAAETQQLKHDHTLIADALTGNDPDAAEAAMRAHLRTAYHGVLTVTSGARGEPPDQA